MVSQKLYTVSVDELFYIGNKTNNTCVYVRNNMPILHILVLFSVQLHILSVACRWTVLE